MEEDLPSQDLAAPAKATHSFDTTLLTEGTSPTGQKQRESQTVPEEPPVERSSSPVDTRRRPLPAHPRSDSVDSSLLSILSCTPPLSPHSLGDLASRPSSSSLSLRSLDHALPRTADRSSGHLQISSALPPKKLVEDRAARAAMFAADRQRKYELAQELRAEWMAQPKTPGPERDGELLREMIMRGI